MMKKNKTTVKTVHLNTFKKALADQVYQKTVNPYAESYTHDLIYKKLKDVIGTKDRHHHESSFRMILWFIEEVMASFNYDLKIDVHHLKETYRDICLYHDVDPSDLYTLLCDLYIEKKMQTKAA